MKTETLKKEEKGNVYHAIIIYLFKFFVKYVPWIYIIKRKARSVCVCVLTMAI